MTTKSLNQPRKHSPSRNEVRSYPITCIMMRPETEELLRVWELGVHRSWAARAVLLVSLADPNSEAHDIIRLSIGERDARLFRLRRLLFGGRLDCLIDCPGCGESLETTLSIDSIMGSFGVTANPESVERITVGESDVVFRLPNSEDLLALEDDPERRADVQLLQRCVVHAMIYGETVPPAALPDTVQHAITKRMAESDPRADVRLDLDCPQCHHRWQAGFDIVSHLWLEIDAWARRIMGDVHVLASAYGWPERDILTMTEARRTAYLDMIAV